ncbi:TlpA family protein disulfide reductase [Cellulomonas sp. McL0617]|uniref:TlpA family protein disulfide reductase n=1 Tax=Cellulomonas sp. McL0617 TaxID=3415675 RepID=UPI003CF93FD1
MAALVGALVVLSGCGQPTHTGDVAQQGYQSGDGSTRTWAVADRKGPLELKGTDYEGTAQDVSAWRGDVVVLNTWYANCPPCRAEAPDLVALADDYAPKGVHVLGINHTDDAGDAQSFQTKFAVPYPSIDDTDGSAIAALEGIVPINAVPTTIVLDRSGRVAARLLGVVQPSTLRSMVDELVAEPAPTPAS